MKKYLPFSLIIAFLVFGYSNNPITPDSRVIDYLGLEKVEIIQKNNPELIRYYNFFLDNAYEIAKVPADKLADNNFPTLKLPLKNGKVDIKKLNVLKLNIERKFDKQVYYKIQNSSEIIVFLAKKIS